MKSIIIFLALLFLSLLISTILLYDPKAQEIGYTVDTIPACYHVIRPGDTLWGIARSLSGPETDTRETLYSITTLNPHLDPGRLLPGTPVTLPVCGKD